MNYFPITTHQRYIPIWKKYRPVILKLMVDSVKGTQEYRFANHEFRDVDPKPKGGHSFVLRLYEGKPINDIRESVIAKELQAILSHSKKASELTAEAIYEIAMDKQFVLRVTQEEAPQKEEELEDQEPAAEQDAAPVEDAVSADKPEATTADEALNADESTEEEEEVPEEASKQKV